VAIPTRFEYPLVEFAPLPPPPPPLEINDDFEFTPAGSPPADAEANVENRGDFIRVTDETAAGGTRSIKIQDAPGLQSTFNPHLVYKPNYTAGQAHCSFDLRLEPGAHLFHEWRSWDVDPYRIGPSMWIQDGKLTVGGSPLMDLPAGQWFHVEITAKVGTAADGKWNLTVVLPGEQPRRFPDLAVASPEFKNFTWTGWCSMATDKTAFYLDNLRIKNE
jgi:hypothetical protein